MNSNIDFQSVVSVCLETVLFSSIEVSIISSQLYSLLAKIKTANCHISICILYMTSTLSKYEEKFPCTLYFFHIRACPLYTTLCSNHRSHGITFHQSYFGICCPKTEKPNAKKMMILLIFRCDCVILLQDSYIETILILCPVSLVDRYIIQICRG